MMVESIGTSLEIGPLSRMGTGSADDTVALFLRNQNEIRWIDDTK